MFSIRFKECFDHIDVKSKKNKVGEEKQGEKSEDK